MKRCLLKIIIAASCIFSFTNGRAQENTEQIEKKYQILIQSLKNQFSLKQAEVKIEADGFWYFLLIGKNDLLGVADQQGKIIIPTENTKIDYHTAEAAGINLFLAKDIKDKYKEFLYHYPKSEPAFHVQYGSFTESDKDTISLNVRPFHKFIQKTGQVSIDSLKYVKKVPGFWIVSQNKEIQQNNYGCTYSGSGGIGLLKTDGTVVLPPINQSISLGYLYQTDTPKNKARYKQCTFQRLNKEEVSTGGINLMDNQNSVPCMFNTVRMEEDSVGIIYWKVKRTKERDYERYHTDSSYTIRYQDKGEKLYEEHKYKEAISFYSNEGKELPWAKFYIGASYYYICLKQYISSKSLMSTLHNTSHKVYYNNIPYIKDFSKAQKALKEYLETRDNRFTSSAKKYLENIKKIQPQ